MRFSSHAHIKTLFIMVVFFTSNAFAAPCYEQSPNLASQGDEYYNLEEPIALSNSEQNQVKNLFKQLRGKWSGNGKHIECLGSDSAPKEKIYEAKLRVKTESKRALHLAFIAEIKNLSNGVTRKEKVDLIGNNPVYSFESINATHITFSEKFRSASGLVKQNKKRFTRLIENIYELELNSNNLNFKKTYYINGIYVGKDEWQLRPGL